jgi:hypothetical protein
MESCLLNTAEYNGKYVTFENDSSNTVIGSGATPQEAWDQAISKGYLSPVLLYVEETGSVLIYPICGKRG